LINHLSFQGIGAGWYVGDVRVESPTEGKIYGVSCNNWYRKWLLDLGNKSLEGVLETL
jgi:hypothetical protein